MNRQELLSLLKAIEPALSAKEYIAIFSCIAFDGEKATTYDDVLALRIPCDIGFVGGVKGKVLLEFLRASKAKTVDFSTNEAGTATLVKAGKSKLTLSRVDPKDFIFETPDETGAIELPLNEGVIDALHKVSVSIGSDPTHPWRLGVTLTVNNDICSIYSSNGYTLSKAEVGIDPPSKNALQVILPPRFIELLLARIGRDSLTSLTVSPAWVKATFESGLELYSKSIRDVDAGRFEKIIDDVKRDITESHAVEIPALLFRCMKRAQVVLTSIWIGANSVATDKFSSFSIKDGLLSIHTIASRGDVHDRVKLPGHPDAELKTAPELLIRALPLGKTIEFIPGACVRILGENFEHLISVHSDGTAEQAPVAEDPDLVEVGVDDAGGDGDDD